MSDERAGFGNWERFQRGLSVDASIPTVVLDSWTRSRSARVDASVPRFRSVAPQDLARRLSEEAPLLAAASPELAAFSRALPVDHVIYLTDATGVVLTFSGARALAQAACVLPGYDWSEAAMGTNGAGTALATGRPVAVVGEQHYCAAWHGTGCLAAPLWDPRGRLAGAVDLTTAAADATPARFADVVRLAAAIERRWAEAPAQVLGSGAEQIYVADESEDQRALLAEMLRFAGFHAVPFATGPELLSAAIARRPRLVMLDVFMPGMDGIEVCWRLRADPRTARVPIVVFTGDHGARLPALSAGASAFLLKPVSMDAVVTTVRQFVAAGPDGGSDGDQG